METMTSNSSYEDHLLAENAELRVRLEEAEDTLRAIRKGEVEALVVETSDGPQVFMLQGIDKESNRFRGELLAQVSDSIIAVDVEDRITFLNAAAARQYGVSADGVLGRKLSEIFTRHWPSEEAEAVTWNALREQGEWHGEIAHRTHDGREFAMETSVAVVRDVRGAPAGYVRVFRDITERLQSEAAIRTSEIRYRRLFESAKDGILILDGQTGQITDANPYILDILGLTLAQVIGREMWEIGVWRDATASRAAMAELQHRGYVRYEDLPLESKIGQRRDVEVVANVYQENGDRVIQCNIRDITQRKATELTLRISEEFTRRVLDNLFAFVGVLTPDGILIEANRSPLTAAGISASEVIGKPFWDAYWWSYSPEVQTRVRAECEKAARGETIRHDVPVRMAGGEIKWIDFQIAPLRDPEGRITHLIPSAMDISERKITTEKLWHSEEKLRDADRTKDEFLATLAHELRNPLAPIRNSLEMLKWESGNVELLNQARETMERQMAHMVRLIDDLLDVSRISRNKLVLKKELVDVAAVIHQAVEACQPQFDCFHHEFILNLPPEPIYLYGDSTRLTQVIGNLLTNACKYSERSGKIWLTVEREVADVKIIVQDIGIGIPPEMLDKVFDMFTQIDRSLERSDGGLGIGLSLVKRLVELHGGTVSAYSEGLGHGSKFTVRLPCEIGQPGIESLAQAPDIARAKSAGRRILVVDDNRDSAITLALLLKITGNETKTAFDGLAAIETAEAFRPQVILLDIGLPKMNGNDTCREIRKQPWGKDILILALTGWGQEEDRRKTAEAGFDDHLVKPVDHVALNKLISDSKKSQFPSY